MTDDDGLPTLTWGGPDATVERMVREAQLLLLAEPVAFQKVYAALVEEGRAVAATPEGRERRDRLARSPLVARIRAVWEPATFNALEAAPDRPLPSSYVDALTLALDLPRLETLLVGLSAARRSGG